MFSILLFKIRYENKYRFFLQINKMSTKGNRSFYVLRSLWVYLFFCCNQLIYDYFFDRILKFYEVLTNIYYFIQKFENEKY